MKFFCQLLTACLCFALIGCASNVQRPSDLAAYAPSGEKFCKVELSINKEATTDLNDIARFEDDKLRDMIERKLGACGLMDTAAINQVRIEITDIRIRSAFNAFMWGVMAGNDHIHGDVTLLGADGTPLHTFKVSASYALGGLAGMNETRMSWLFEEFSKLTVAEITGARTEG